MSKNRRVIEALKDLLIVALTCSAIWLVAESRLFRAADMLGQTQHSSGSTAGTQIGGQSVLPLRMAVMNQGGCCDIQYGSQDMADVFSRMAPLLNEALSGIDIPSPITREQWEQALICAPGVYFDFQGAIPLRVLSGWLSGQESLGLATQVRHLVLTIDQQEQVVLAYREESSGQYFACRAQLVNPGHLQSAVAQVQPNGAIFAHQSPKYSMLAPHTVISAQTPQLNEYTASNPLLEDGERRLDELLEELSFPLGITTIYETPEGCRVRSGNDTLSVANDGLITYYSTREEARYPVLGTDGADSLFAAVDGADRLVRSVLEPWCGQARIYLADVEEQGEQVWRLEFRYALKDTPVQVGQRGYAATLLIDHGYITEYELQLRTYAALEQMTLILPQEQAAAILESLGQSGSQLQLQYQDSGDTVRAGWIAGN